MRRTGYPGRFLRAALGTRTRELFFNERSRTTFA